MKVSKLNVIQCVHVQTACTEQMQLSYTRVHVVHEYGLNWCSNALNWFNWTCFVSVCMYTLHNKSRIFLMSKRGKQSNASVRILLLIQTQNSTRTSAGRQRSALDHKACCYSCSIQSRTEYANTPHLEPICMHQCNHKYVQKLLHLQD